MFMIPVRQQASKEEHDRVEDRMIVQKEQVKHEPKTKMEFTAESNHPPSLVQYTPYLKIVFTLAK